MNSNEKAGAAKKKKKPIFFIQLFLIAGGLLLVWFSFNSNVLEARQPKTVPDNVGRMELLNVVEGEEAITSVTRLHGTPIKLDNAVIANYGHGGEKVTVWIGKAADTAAATDLQNRMVQAIGKGGSEFSEMQPVAVGERAVVGVKGPGGAHYFYQQDREVVWLIIQSSKPEEVLKLAVKIFQNY